MIGFLVIERGYNTTDQDIRVLTAAGAIFGLTILTHPIYTILFIVSTITFCILYIPNFDGLQRGAIIAGVGILIASPWLFTVLFHHGFETLLSPGKRFSSGFKFILIAFFSSFFVSGWVYRRYSRSIQKTAKAASILTLIILTLVLFVNLKSPWQTLLAVFDATNVSPVGYIFIAGAVIGSAYLIRQGQYFIPVITVVWMFVYPHYPSEYALLAILTGIAIVQVSNNLSYLLSLRWDFTGTRSILLSLCLLTAVIWGAAYAANHHTSMSPSVVGSPPNELNEQALEAMRWANTETTQSSTFLLGVEETGILVDWFPAIAHRPVSVSPWGTEWVNEKYYNRRYHMGVTISAVECNEAACYSDVIDRMETKPNYLMVSSAEETSHSFRKSGEFEIVFRNGRYIIAEYK